MKRIVCYEFNESRVKAQEFFDILSFYHDSVAYLFEQMENLVFQKDIMVQVMFFELTINIRDAFCSNSLACSTKANGLN
jgi:hypothetical protein